MSVGIIVVASWMGFVALFGIVLLGWAVYSGQLDDVESLKYLVFRSDEPEDWPGRGTNEVTRG